MGHTNDHYLYTSLHRPGDDGGSHITDDTQAAGRSEGEARAQAHIER